MVILRSLAIVFSIVLIWQIACWAMDIPPYILPSPIQVGLAFYNNFALLSQNSWVTFLEIILGLLTGGTFGFVLAMILAYYNGLRHWLLPLIVISQAIPVFALAPLFVLWFGYDMLPKVLMAAIIIFFPITTAFLDGLLKTTKNWVDAATVMNATKWKILIHIRLPSALPNLASGLKIGTAVAPIGAVIGEWIGAGQGLGYVMIQANARGKVDVVFAVLIILSIGGTSLFFLSSYVSNKIIGKFFPQEDQPLLYSENK